MPEYNQLRLWEEYDPKVNDYVIWDKGEYGKDEGWVYFKDEEYITIETNVKRKPPDDYCKNPMHKMIHTLLLCNNQYWHQLKYVKSRTPCERIEHYSQCDD
tara:strand:+ start:211 stop:513 length:303 start_codon:yes stop_codon:yes gene_type:complete